MKPNVEAERSLAAKAIWKLFFAIPTGLRTGQSRATWQISLSQAGVQGEELEPPHAGSNPMRFLLQGRVQRLVPTSLVSLPELGSSEDLALPFFSFARLRSRLYEARREEARKCLYSPLYKRPILKATFKNFSFTRLPLSSCV